MRVGFKKASEWRDVHQLQVSQLSLHEYPIGGCVRHYSSQQVLGEEHPGTLILLNTLANCLFSQSKHSEAEPMFWQALAGQQKVGLAGVGWGHLLLASGYSEGATSHIECLSSKLIATVRVGSRKWVSGMIIASCK